MMNAHLDVTERIGSRLFVEIYYCMLPVFLLAFPSSLIYGPISTFLIIFYATLIIFRLQTNKGRRVYRRRNNQVG